MIGDDTRRSSADSSIAADIEAAFNQHYEQREHTANELDSSVRTVRQLTEDEIRAVRSGSKVVYFILASVAITLSVAVCLFVNRTQQNEFISEFHSYAREVADIANNNAGNTFEQLDTLATTITSIGSDTGSSFPNVTIPHFDVRALDLVEASGVEMVMFVPLVEELNQEGFQAYIQGRLRDHRDYHDTHLGPHYAAHNGDIAESTDVHSDDMHNAQHNNSMASNTSHVGMVDDMLPSMQDGMQDEMHEPSHNNMHSHSMDGMDMEQKDSESEIDIWDKTIRPCEGCNEVNETREGFEDGDLFMEVILEELGYQPDGLVAPVAQYGPIEDSSGAYPVLLQDLYTHPSFKKEMVAAIEYDVSVISETVNLDFLLDQTYHHTSSSPWEMSGHEHHGMHHMQAPENVLRSFTLDPVKESFLPNARTIGFVVGILPWSTFFAKILHNERHQYHEAKAKEVNGLVALMVSDCGTSFTYVLNGAKSDEAYEGDFRELYEDFEHITHNVPFFWKEHPKGKSRHCHFDLHLYPSEEFYSAYQTNDGLFYGGLVILVFAFTSILFYLYDRYVFKRQQLVIAEATSMVVYNAKKAARNERDLNDFIAHEVRNPLAAAMSACSFVSSAVLDENNAKMTVEKRSSVEDDLEIIDSSLHFINDLLRNMLDMQRASTSQMTIEYKPVHLLDDIFRPVANMLHVKGVDMKVELDCEPKDLVVMSDPLRLKQILLNLSRNSVKFVEHGFIRLKARVVASKWDSVEISVEDSGPGIPEEKRDQLFGKFQESLDTLNQGTGIGLNLCKKLSELMDARLYIDEDYFSGISGYPGARFVLDMRKQPLELHDDLLTRLSTRTQRKSYRQLEASEDSCTSTTVPESDSSSHFSDGNDQKSTKQLELPEEYSVLFVDDDMVLRKLFMRSLRKVAPSWSVDEAANGETAVKMVEGDPGKYSLIFMDQYMASVQKQLLGTEATRILRSNGVSCKICGLSANDVEKAFLDAGATDFMFKPFPCKPDLLKAELLKIIYGGETEIANPESDSSAATPTQEKNDEVAISDQKVNENMGREGDDTLNRSLRKEGDDTLNRSLRKEGEDTLSRSLRCCHAGLVTRI